MPLRGVSKENTSSLANLWLLSFRKESNRGCGLRKPAMWFAGTLLQKHCGRGVRKPTMWFAGTLLQKYCGRRLRKPAIVFAESSEKETSFPSHTRKGGRESETSRLALHRQRELCPASSWCKKEKKRPKPVRLRSL